MRCNCLLACRLSPQLSNKWQGKSVRAEAASLAASRSSRAFSAPEFPHRVARAQIRQGTGPRLTQRAAKHQSVPPRLSKSLFASRRNPTPSFFNSEVLAVTPSRQGFGALRASRLRAEIKGSGGFGHALLVEQAQRCKDGAAPADRSGFGGYFDSGGQRSRWSLGTSLCK